jgi:hypothetical protein
LARSIYYEVPHYVVFSSVLSIMPLPSSRPIG